MSQQTSEMRTQIGTRIAMLRDALTVVSWQAMLANAQEIDSAKPTYDSRFVGNPFVPENVEINTSHQQQPESRWQVVDEIAENCGMATKTPVTGPLGKQRLPVVVSVPDPMRYFANDGAVVRLLALVIVKVPATLALLYAASHWIR